MVNRGLIAREKEDKKPKVIENPKTALILSGRKMSQTVREVLGAFVCIIHYFNQVAQNQSST